MTCTRFPSGPISYPEGAKISGSFGPKLNGSVRFYRKVSKKLVYHLRWTPLFPVGPVSILVEWIAPRVGQSFLTNKPEDSGYEIASRPGCSKLGQDKPRVSAKFELRYESLKSKFSLIHFAYNLMIGYSKKNRENYPRDFF